ncbi:hypothetical protein E4U44_003214 [Claviceps purpurea]|nr:hypothetical protein E4U44_003214 [Claviceps purpurea]
MYDVPVGIHLDRQARTSDQQKKEVPEKSRHGQAEQEQKKELMKIPQARDALRPEVVEMSDAVTQRQQ